VLRARKNDVRPDEHSSPRIILFHRHAWRDYRSRAQNAIRHPTAGDQRADSAVGRRSRREIISAPALSPYAGWSRALRVCRTLLFACPGDVGAPAWRNAQRLRLAALTTILRDHLPNLLVRHRRRFPHLKLRLHDANQAMAEALLKKQEIDLAITELEGKPAMGIRSEALLQVPLVLLVPKNDAPSPRAKF